MLVDAAQWSRMDVAYWERHGASGDCLGGAQGYSCRINDRSNSRMSGNGRMFSIICA